MKLVEIKSNWKDSELRIEFMLGNTCNYKCWYCFPDSNTGTHRWQDYDLIVKNFVHLIREYKALGKKKIYVQIIGGEPTIWPKLGDFAKVLHEEGCIVSMSTNGSRTIRWWKENAKYFNKIILSCHHQEMDVEHSIQVADIIYESNCIVDASVLMDPREWDKCTAIVEQLKTSKHRWSIIASEVLHDTINYTQEQLEYILGHIKRRPNLWYFLKNNKYHNDSVKVMFADGSSKRVQPNWISLNGLNHFYGWQCNVGVDSLFITKDGVISGACGIKLYGNPEYYNFYDLDFSEKFKPTLTPVKCNLVGCYCQPEINLRKKVIPVVPVSSMEYPLNKYSSS